MVGSILVGVLFSRVRAMELHRLAKALGWRRRSAAGLWLVGVGDADDVCSSVTLNPLPQPAESVLPARYGREIGSFHTGGYCSFRASFGVSKMERQTRTPDT